MLSNFSQHNALTKNIRFTSITDTITPIRTSISGRRTDDIFFTASSNEFPSEHLSNESFPNGIICEKHSIDKPETVICEPSCNCGNIRGPHNLENIITPNSREKHDTDDDWEEILENCKDAIQMKFLPIQNILTGTSCDIVSAVTTNIPKSVTNAQYASYKAAIKATIQICEQDINSKMKLKKLKDEKLNLNFQ
ncbi:hypothetical protein SNEBB_004229 [Seison nebaliae]|nr:hypothetical protein SNEBB_004229 [Seison nebaliae]